jgi:hypothetical protein
MKTLRQTILAMASYYGRTLDEGLLEMYHEDLADLDPLKCMAAYAQYRRNPENKTFPLPAQIRELVCPDEFVAPEVKARETAARIIGAISKFGWSNAKEAQVYIGPEGWQAVQRQGGWSHLCEQTSKYNELTLQAQLRDQLVGTFKHGSRAIEQSIGALTHRNNRTGELEPVADVVAMIASRKDDDQEPA